MADVPVASTVIGDGAAAVPAGGVSAAAAMCADKFKESILAVLRR